jgi:iron(III) transport system ATP-binding protein
METGKISETVVRQRGRAGASFAGAITFEHVSYSVRGLAVLNDISLTFEAGKVSCLLGPSGCGKTTVLRLAAGVARPTGGRILIEDEVVAGPHRFVAPEKRNVGLMFQDYALFPHLTVLQNVCFGLTALSADQAKSAALNALERVGLSALAQRLPNQLSGGEQQRVALARAIVPRPQVILMDEPFSGLDQRLRDQVRADTLAVVRETRATAVLVTHDPMEAMEVADRIYLMRAGTLLQHGSPRELYDNPLDAGAAQFFAQHNALSGIAQNGRVATAVGVFEARHLGNGLRATVLVKPPAFRLADGETGFSAFVREVRFLGEAQRLSLAMEGQETLLEAVIPAQYPVEVGTLRRFVIDPEGVFVFTSA